ncbi:hypothetical protein FRB90_005972 [Tulasnella sp. 427]|nr:hypothetical protein FRB90_005972 [Tulasnella sp. 427]
MSQPNPRKAGPRTPNGTDTSPAAASSDAPAQTVPQPIHHPLPKHPHTYIPAHLKSNGPRSQYSKGRSTSSRSAVDESPEIKALRDKYGDKLAPLKETFGNWTDEDLLTLLAECNGNGDIAATKILEGHAEHWDSVSHKKKDKNTPAGVTGGPHTAARDRAEAGGSASPGRGGLRGGRGGTPGRGGIRGGRGGFAGGRGGHSNEAGGSGKVALVHGIPATADGAAASPAAEGTPAAGSDPSTSVWANEGTSSTGPEPLNGVAKEKVAPGKASPKAQKGAKPPAPAGPPKMSWAQIAKKGKPEAPVPPPVKAAPPVPPSVAPSAPTQPAAESTLAEAPGPEPEPVAEEPTPHDEPAAEPETTEDDGPEEVTTAPSDDWIAITPPNQKIPVELPASSTPAVEEPKVVEEEPKATIPEPSKPAEVPATTQQPTSATLQPTGAPPGLSPVPQPAPAPSTTAVSAPAPTIPSTAPTSVPAKTSTPRLGSSRPASRFRVTDAPVVMPGGGLPTPVFGGLSFGNAINASGTSFGGSGLESRFGMQFGSLSLNDDLDALEPPAPEPSAPTTQHEAPAPAPVEPEQAPAPAPVSAPAPAPLQAPAATSQAPQPSPQPVVAPQPSVPAQPVQQSPRVLSSSTAINSLFQHAQQPTPQSVAPQIAPPQGLSPAQQQQPTQQPTPTSASKVDSLPPFLQQGAPGLLSQLQQQQQQQSHHVQPTQQQVSASHLPPHLTQPQQLGSPAQQSQQLAGSQPQQSLPYNVGSGQHLPPHLDTSSLPQTQQPASATSISAPHPALAAQNSYFRNAGADSSFYHAPTPPQTQLPQQLQQQDHSSAYGAFSPLGQPQQSQGGHLGGFSNSPAVGDYGGYDAQGRQSFYDSYGQGSNFQNRPQLAHDEPSKGALQPSTPTNVLPGQQNLNLGQGQPGSAQPGVANPGGFNMMPYFYQQPYFPPPPAQYNPYSQYKYPYSQPPPGPAGPGPQGLQGNKPPTTGTASPYGSQPYPSASSPYDDPNSAGYQQGTGSVADYQKQQPMYGQGFQNLFVNQGTAQSGSPLAATPGGRSGATSSSPENPYKSYGGGPGVGADKGAAGQQATAGRTAGGPGPQPQQGSYYPNQYSAQRQPPAQGYPQGDGQQYYSGYQPRNQYGGGW